MLDGMIHSAPPLPRNLNFLGIILVFTPPRCRYGLRRVGVPFFHGGLFRATIRRGKYFNGD